MAGGIGVVNGFQITHLDQEVRGTGLQGNFKTGLPESRRNAKRGFEAESLHRTRTTVVWLKESELNIRPVQGRWTKSWLPRARVQQQSQGLCCGLQDQFPPPEMRRSFQLGHILSLLFSFGFFFVAYA